MANLRVVNQRCLNTWKQIRHNGIEQRQIHRSQLCYVHVFHGEQEDLSEKEYLPSTIAHFIATGFHYIFFPLSQYTYSYN